MKPISTAILLISLLAATGRAADGPCVDTPNAIPIARGDEVVCRVEQTIDSTTSPELLQQTKGLVTAIELQADLRFPVRPALSVGGTVDTLALSPQTVHGVIHLVGGKLSPLEIVLAPRVTFTGHGVCDIALTSVDPGVQKFSTELPGWVEALLLGTLKAKLTELTDQAQQSLSEGLQPIREASCDLAPATPVGDADLSDPRLPALRQKVEKYLAWGRAGLDEHGWIADTHCDGLLMNSLYTVAGGPAEIALAAYEDGRWDRHWQKDCYPDHSASTISRDMMTGLSHWLLSSGRADLVERTIQYGERHAFEGFPLIWIVGQGDIGRVDAPPASISRLYRLREKLTGAPDPYPALQTQVFADCQSYACHLDALDTFFWYRLEGQLTQSAQRALQTLADTRPRNALFNVLYGKLARSRAHLARGLDVLLDPTLFPEDRLPSTLDRCNDYIFSREEVDEQGQISDNWLPCPNEPLKVFSGTDFLFAAAIALDLIPG